MASTESTDPDDTRPAELGAARAPALKEVLEGIEHELILAALRASHGNKAKAARVLGITERLMGLRVKRLGIDWRRLRARGKGSSEEAI
jgi:transcriptional regulator with GAF, ATPase, and Fis domain